MEEGAFPTTADNLESIPAKIGAIQFRVHGLLDRMLAAVKHLAALIARMEMENRAHGSHPGPPDYPQAPWVYYGDQRPNREEEPSWRKSLLGSIVAPLIVLGVPAILGILWQMSGRLTKIEEHQSGDQKLTFQRLDAQEKHLEADDRRLDEQDKRLNEIDRVWPRKH
jgi:hypothetical protein